MPTNLPGTDVVIVGMGAAGGVAALPLARAGLKVIGLEAGTWLTRRDFAPDEIRNNIRDLEGCLVRLLAVGSLTHQEITLALAHEVLAQYVDAEPDLITPERIVSLVAERSGIRPEQLCGPRRTRAVALPRQIAMYLCRQLTELSLVEIGAVFGGRDHSTVLYACEKVATLLVKDSHFADKVNALISTLASG